MKEKDGWDLSWRFRIQVSRERQRFSGAVREKKKKKKNADWMLTGFRFFRKIRFKRLVLYVSFLEGAMLW